MSFIYKKNVFAQILGLALVLLALGFWTSGCTLGECESGQREICVGDDCKCGDKCATDDNCTAQDTDAPQGTLQRCFAYEFTPEHGVCVNSTYFDKHGWDRNLPIPQVTPVGL